MWRRSSERANCVGSGDENVRFYFCAQNVHTARDVLISHRARRDQRAPGGGFVGRVAASRNVVTSISTWRGSKGLGGYATAPSRRREGGERGVGGRGDHDDGQATVHAMDLPEQGEPAHAGHLQIEEHQIGELTHHRVQTRLTVGRALRLEVVGVPHRPQDVGQRAAHVRLVVDDQHAPRRHDSRPLYHPGRGAPNRLEVPT